MFARMPCMVLATIVVATVSVPAAADDLPRHTASPASATTDTTRTSAAQARRAKRRRQPVHRPVDATTTPAYRYGQLTQEACEAQLVERGVAFVREPARGVLAPVRLTAPLRGVEFRTRLSEAARATTPWEIADCRLVLALDDFAEILARHDIVEVRHYSMWRPPAKAWPEGKLAAQHAGALALDAGKFVDREGTVIDVEDDWQGRIGAKTCGPKARPRRQTPAALALRAILCEAAAARLFNVVLTPNHNRGHRNHFHLEVTAGVTWFIVD